jgi:hypothetical protein
MSTGLQSAEHEVAVIRSFIVSGKQECFVGFLAKPWTRKKFIKYLSHFRWFDHRFAAPVLWKVDPALKLWARHVQGVSNIYRLLESKGAGRTCWVMSESEDLDGRELDPQWALEKAIESQRGTILLCVRGKLALYFGEDEMILLSR